PRPERLPHRLDGDNRTRRLRNERNNTHGHTHDDGRWRVVHLTDQRYVMHPEPERSVVIRPWQQPTLPCVVVAASCDRQAGLTLHQRRVEGVPVRTHLREERIQLNLL